MSEHEQSEELPEIKPVPFQHVGTIRVRVKSITKMKPRTIEVENDPDSIEKRQTRKTQATDFPQSWSIDGFE